MLNKESQSFRGSNFVKGGDGVRFMPGLGKCGDNGQWVPQKENWNSNKQVVSPIVSGVNTRVNVDESFGNKIGHPSCLAIVGFAKDMEE